MSDQPTDYENERVETDIFRNNHDLIGIEGIIRAQKNEIEKKKVILFSLYIFYETLI